MKGLLANFGMGGRARHSVRAAEKSARNDQQMRRAEDCPPYLRGASWTASVLPQRAKARQRDGGWRFGIMLLMFVCAGNLFAADVAGDFSAANKLYAEGKFSDAANAYEKILQTGGQSPALLFNYANAEFKAGNLGKAIAAYRRAAQLSPRNSEIRANLDFVRNQVQGPAMREGRREAWLGQLTLNEWALLASVTLWVTFLLLAAEQIRPVLGAKLRRVTVIFAMLAILSGAALGVQAAEHYYKATAVVIASEATARSGPFDEAQSAFTVRNGAELTVLDRHDNWVQVADGSGKIGWMSAKQVETLPGA